VTEVRAEKPLEDLPKADKKSMKKQDINSEMKTIYLEKKKLLP
jgi:hypothetical protein